MRKNIQKLATSVAQSGIETAGEGAFALGRTAWLLSLGLAATAGETGREVFDALVDKGRRRRRTRIQQAQQAITETGSTMLKLANDATRMAQQRAAEVMGKLGLPTRDDVRELVRRVDTLRQKLV